MQSAFEHFKQEAEPLLGQLSELRGSTVFPILFHFQASIAPWIITEMYDFLVRIGGHTSKNVDVLLSSTGGDADAAFHIGKMLHRLTKGTLSFIVPRIAASAATLLTFAGNKILMSSPTGLGPIDPQIEVSLNRFVSARSLKDTFDLFLGKIIEHPDLPKPIVEALLERLPLTELVDYERLLEHVEELAVDLLKLRMVTDESKAEQIAKKFVRGFKYHGRNITIDDALAIGLSVEELPSVQWNLVWKFNKMWEAIALISAEEGSDILTLGIGDGVAFVPRKKAERAEREESPLDTMISKM